MAKALRPGEDVSRNQARSLSAADPRVKALGISKNVAKELGEYRASSGTFESPAAPLPNIPNRTTSPKTGQFAEAQAILADLSNVTSTLESSESTVEQKQQASARFERAKRKLESLGLGATELADFYYDPKTFDYYTSGDYTGTGRLQAENAVVLTDIPTSSTNFRRPRTVAAGYDPENRIVTVIFRDGTAWNYYGVPEDAWIKFHQSITKGPFINNAQTNKGRGPGDLLTYNGHGPADVSQLSPKAQQEFYRISRASQIVSRDKSTGAAKQNKRPKSQPNLERAKNREWYAKRQAKLGTNKSSNNGRK